MTRDAGPVPFSFSQETPSREDRQKEKDDREPEKETRAREVPSQSMKG